MSPIIQCSGKKGEKIEALAFFFLQLTIPQSPGISSDLKIYSKPD